MRYFEIGDIRIFLLFPFLHPIFCFIKSNLHIKINDFFPTYKNLPNSLISCCLVHISLLIQIFPEIISRIRQKRKNLDLIQRKIEKKKFVFSDINLLNYKAIGLIFLSNIFSFYPDFLLSYIASATQFYFYLARFSLLFFSAIQSYFVLNMKIYSHQQISMIIMFCGTLFFILITKSYMEFGLIEFLFQIILNFLITLSLCINKFILEIYYISPFMILFIQGIFGIILDFLIIFILNKLDTLIISDFSFFLKNVNILNLLMYSFFYSLTEIFILLTNFYFSPTMVLVSDYISAFALELYRDNKWYKIIGYFILLVGCFVYNEIIIINFCNLNKFTKREISRRSIKESHIQPFTEEESLSENDN